MTTGCGLCADLTRMIDRHWPVAEIVDHTGMDTATLGRHLRNHGRTGEATALDPRDPAYVQAALCPGGDYAALRGTQHHDATCPDVCPSILGGLLGGVLTALTARALEHRALTRRTTT